MKKLIALLILLPLFAFAQPIQRNAWDTNTDAQVQALFNPNQFGFDVNNNLVIKGSVRLTNLNVFSSYNQSSGSFSFLGNVGFTANTLLQLDNLNVMISVPNGPGILTNNGAGGFGYSPSVSVTQASVGVLILTNPPVLNLQASTNLFGQNVIWNTNKADGVVNLVVGKYMSIVTNNNFTLPTAFLTGPQWAATNINWGGLDISNSAATAITMIVPGNCTCPGTAPGTANTFFITNCAFFSAYSVGPVRTNGVFRSFP